MKTKFTLLLFLTCFSFSTFSQLKILNNGKIGLGTTTPRYNLDIITDSDTNDTIMIGKEDHGNKLMIEMQYAAPGSMGRNGYSGIWIYPLCYPYNSTLGSSSNRWGGIYLMNNPNILSDGRMKKNIQNLTTGVLDKIMNLRPVSYNMKDSLLEYSLQNKETRSTEIGFIAQELKEIFPDVVTEENGVYGVQYASLIPYLVQAIKEQQNLINTLQSEVELMLSQLNLNKLKQQVKENNISLALNGATLYQNNPNPFSSQTEIRMFIPQGVSKSMLCIYDLYGNQLKSYNISEKGDTFISINHSEFKAGIYYYALICDGILIDTKRMILTE